MRPARRRLTTRLGAALAVCVAATLADAASPAFEENPPAGDTRAVHAPAGDEVEALVAEALAKSPDLAAARQDAAAARARVSPAGALPDPMISVSYENDGASPSLGVEQMTRLSLMAQQAFPFPGKLALSERVAGADAARAATRPERLALALGGSVRRAYADLLEAREDLRLVDEQVATWRDIEEDIRARYSAGMGTQQDVLRAQGERTRLLQQRRRDEAAEATAVNVLNQLLYRPVRTPLPTKKELHPGVPPTVPAAHEVVEEALKATPELKDAALAKERAKLAADLARRNLEPDFVASAAYMNRGGLPLMWSAGVGVSIPVWAGKKQRPLIAEAEALREAASAAETGLRRLVEARAEERLIRLGQIADEAKLDAEGVLVQDKLSVDAALASYRTGSAPFVTVLEALGTYFVDRRAAASRLAGFLRAEADLRELSLDRAGPAGSTSTGLAFGASSRM